MTGLTTMRVWLAALACVYATGALAQQLAPFDARRPPAFIDGINNALPLAFGMSAAEAQASLGTPLTYVRGRPGHEIFLTVRSNGGSGFFPRGDRVYLQFRNDRLTGWKADWGSDWIWQPPL